ncbi:hypothetical protein H6G54_19260 [Anabaena cylindrica FACHB-243]|uniref:Uncharacterized protein n=1 Tax=Anabaena cylindrica (strain ATCC 27899 / PCC 7122) TaxID=272123 RepID=K9ZPP8_ANACC|nr:MULTISPECIES: hypothetical protein [Anabaena]AFZ60759.1 hypothetical protein Anacy_5444 [Anabaena cylindrica PCC 7122]MBD2419806.1 hypothetical protein [Anabaena cylindrica FACHB-243]MBY5281333.1 hypothetical protein [Anabaena sp. CCAP 1446/1C]MBY5309018.1 hypothetical protein [Anabaena sp. CCAP 1446/1C]MCM2406759.1 hypothetical protein [Anabaena sp. CCAP 1446/1C]
MMNIQRVLALTTISLVIGTFGFVTPNQAIAATPSARRPQIAQQSHSHQKELQRRNKKPQVKHRHSQPQRGADHNQAKPKNR